MTLAWLFERQQASDQEQANRLLAACGDDPWWIPGLWHLEVTKALLVAERRSVLPQAESDRFLAGLSGHPILTDTAPTPERGTRILALARDHGLSCSRRVDRDVHARRCFRPGARPARHRPGARSDRPHPAAAEGARCGCSEHPWPEARVEREELLAAGRTSH
jgi:hypothetical protein